MGCSEILVAFLVIGFIIYAFTDRIFVTVGIIIAYLLLRYFSKRHKEESWEPVQRALDDYSSMSGAEFEKAVADLLKAEGYSNVRVTPQSGDHGIDILAVSPSGRSTGFQCKCYSEKVGNSAVQQAFSGKHYYGCTDCVVITNTTFTRSAREEAQKLGVELWDQSKLIAMTKTANQYTANDTSGLQMGVIVSFVALILLVCLFFYPLFTTSDKNETTDHTNAVTPTVQPTTTPTISVTPRVTPTKKPTPRVTPTSTPTPTPTPEPEIRGTTTTTVKMRSTPDSKNGDGNVVKYLKTGTEVLVKGQEGDFYKVIYEEIEGYIHAKYLDTSETVNISEEKDSESSGSSSDTNKTNKTRRIAPGQTEYNEHSKTVNKFINAYNAIAELPFGFSNIETDSSKTETTGGRINDVIFKVWGDYDIRVSLTCQNGQEYSDDMRQIFHDVCLVFEPSLSEDDISSFFKAMPQVAHSNSSVNPKEGFRIEPDYLLRGPYFEVIFFYETYYKWW